MARINIEDDFWVDIGAVIAAVGDEDRAIGMVVRFFRFAQAKYARGQEISENDFSDAGFHPSLIGRFAELVLSKTEAKPKQIEAKGSKKHFGWLKQRIESGAKGGRSKTEAKTKNLKQNLRSKTEANRSKTEASSSSSSSSSNSFLKNRKISKKTNRTRRLLEGIKRFGSNESDELKEYLGDELWGVACRVGINRIREMPRDNFTEYNVSGLLKDFEMGVT